MATTDPDHGLSAVDREALGRSIELARTENEMRRQQIDRMLRMWPWMETARYAAYSCQDRALHLKPWQTPPCWLRDDDDVAAALATPTPDLSGDRAAARLVTQLLAAGLSRYEPDIEGALTKHREALACSPSDLPTPSSPPS